MPFADDNDCLEFGIPHGRVLAAAVEKERTSAPGIQYWVNDD
jgi:hypothetical protein